MIRFLKQRPVLIAAVLLSGQGLVYYGWARTEVIPETLRWKEFPQKIGLWSSSSDMPIEQRFLDLLRPDDYVNRVYEQPGVSSQLGLFVAYFKTQRTGFNPHSPQNCLPGAGWKSISLALAPLITGAGDQRVDVNQYVVQKDNAQLAVIYWFQQGRHSFTNEIVAQFYAIPELMLHGRTDNSLIRVIVPVTNGTVEQSTKTAMSFSRELYPEVRAFIK
jgi:EpsI family protein